MNAEIQITNLKKTYSGIQVLKDVHLEISKGSLFALLGPNGAGKSTLVKIITGLVQQDYGEIQIAGTKTPNTGTWIRKYIGVASQDNDLDPLETTESIMRFQARLFGFSKKQAAIRADEMIEMFNMESERYKKTGDLSGGNKRRLHCALALVHDPNILFLDEPTVGMDPVARATFWKVITHLNRTRDKTIFLTTQYLEEADKHACDMALLLDGEVHYSGTVSGFKLLVNNSDRSTLDESYLTYLKSFENEHVSTIKNEKEYEISE